MQEYSPNESQYSKQQIYGHNHRKPKKYKQNTKAALQLGLPVAARTAPRPTLSVKNLWNSSTLMASLASTRLRPNSRSTDRHCRRCDKRWL